jgi:hypothetical protein
MCCEIAKLWLQMKWLFEVAVGVHANALVMPGLDPGIHQVHKNISAKEMDCRSSPAMTDWLRPGYEKPRQCRPAHARQS